MRIEPPKIDERKFSDLVKILKDMVPRYTPEWEGSDQKDPGVGLLDIFSFITETILNRFNQVPEKNFVAFLDMLEIKLLPAQPSRVPVTFKLAQGTDKDILIPSRTQAAADKTEEHDEIPFETEKNLLATMSSLKEIMSVDPFRDAIYVHTQDVVSGDGGVLEKQTAFRIFCGTDQQEHSIYLGHKDLFNIKSKASIFLEITLPSGTEIGNSSLILLWEYWGEDKEMKKDRWISFQVEEDTTDGLRQGGRISLFKTMEGEIKETNISDIFKSTSRTEIKDESIKDIKTRWVRCSLKSALTGDLCSKLLTLDTIFIKTSPAEPIPPEAGFFNDVALDWTQVTIETKVVECPDTTPEILITAVVDTHGLCVDSVEGFRQGDKVEFLKDDILLGTGSIFRVSKNTTSQSQRLTVTLDSPLTITEIGEGSTVRLTIKTTRVYPFGTQPKLYDGFAVGSKEAFSKKGAKLTLSFSLALVDTTSPGLSPRPDPRLAWEYWNGTGWQALTILKDDSDRFMKEGDTEAIEFICPDDIGETELNGQKNYWIRARIIGGDYGRDQYTLGANNVIRVERKYSLPIIRDLKIGYSFEIKKELQYCLTYNNLDFQDRTSESKTKGAVFQPFVPIEDGNLNFYLGVDKPLAGGPIRIFFDASELPYSEETKPEMAWNCWNGTAWKILDHLDETEGLIAQGHLELVGPSGFADKLMFDRPLYWIQGSLTKGKYECLPKVHGIYPNTTWAMQAKTIKDEIIGSSDGEPHQILTFANVPILEGEEVRVREVLTEEERQLLIESSGEEAIYEIKDEKGEVIETWVLWAEVSDFFDSNPKSRHYTMDRAHGEIGFGDGIKGMIPPADDNNIKAFSYQTGGGAQGNIKLGEIKSLKSAVAGVDKASNFVAADGGANTATLDEMLEIGPAQISHRNRAVTIEDFEWLAKQAARRVVKAKCLPNTNNKKQKEIGWVTVIIVPDSREDKPFPSLSLRRKVKQYLEAHSANTLSSAQHIYIDGPSYIEIGVSADVFIASIDFVSIVAREVRAKLDAFLHPLTGGTEGKGWDFGRSIPASDIYALLEGIEGVDHVENVQFTYNGTSGDDIVRIKENYLVAKGTHKIDIQIVKGG